MKTAWSIVVALGCVFGAAPRLAADGAPSAREIQTAVDSCLAAYNPTGERRGPDPLPVAAGSL